MKSEVTLKKYIIVILLFIITILMGLYVINYYNDSKNYKNSEEKIMSFLPEIDSVNLNNYIIDNHEAIIYMSDSNDVSIRNFEFKLKKYFIKENLEKTVLYLDANELDSNFYEDFRSKYGSNYNINSNNIPCIIIIENDIVKSVLCKDNNNLEINDVKKFFKDNGVAE